MDTRSEQYVRETLLPCAERIFSSAFFRMNKGRRLEDFIAVPIVFIRSEYWELGFIPIADEPRRETQGAFVYGVSTDSIFGPFWCYYLDGRWVLYLVSD